MNLAVIGCGAMGRGIAEVAAMSGCDTVLVKATPGALDGTRHAIAESLLRGRKKGRFTEAELELAEARLTLTQDLAQVAECDLVIESIVESMEAKRALFQTVEPLVKPSCVLATNTSSLPLAQLASALKTPARFLGMHFFSPVQAMKLVEVGITARTYPHAVERATAFVERLGKTAILVSGSSGYVVNRLLVPYLLDGIATLEERLAPAATIDRAMKLGCGHPMGPLELSDAIGLDVVYAMAKSLFRELGDRRYSPPALLRRLVGSGHFGRKSGAGVYVYPPGAPPRENPDLWPDDAGHART
jgi:3-hydroxybutyryl-CoA dehydrogenase